MMLDNFDKTTVNGRRNLLTALTDQVLFRGVDLADVEPLVELVTLAEYKAGDTIIEQGHPSTDVFLILAGGAEVTIDRRHIGFRKPGDHIGEMAAIDPGATRCACVLAQANTVIARIAAEELLALANAKPRVWLNLTRVLAARLRARPVRPRNEQAEVFIGSSTEKLGAAEHLNRLFAYKPFVSRPWTVGVFRPSGVTIDDLLRQAEASDFAVMAFGPDDTTIGRDGAEPSPRDNVVLEYGLYVGALGSRERVFVVAPRGVDLKIPSDILGLKILTYATDKPLDVALAPVASEISEAVARLGPR